MTASISVLLKAFIIFNIIRITGNAGGANVQKFLIPLCQSDILYLRVQKTISELSMKERYNYIDYSKAFAILLVITGHICLFCINRGNVNNADNMRIYSWLTVFQMPLFFFLSGIVIKHKDYSIKETIKHLYKKTRQLLVPFFLFGTIFTLFIHQGFCEFITPVMKQGY